MRFLPVWLPVRYEDALSAGAMGYSMLQPLSI